MQREEVRVEIGVRDRRFRFADERKPESVGDALEKVLQKPSSSLSRVRIMMNTGNPSGEALLGRRRFESAAAQNAAAECGGVFARVRGAVAPERALAPREERAHRGGLVGR